MTQNTLLLSLPNPSLSLSSIQKLNPANAPSDVPASRPRQLRPDKAPPITGSQPGCPAAVLALTWPLQRREEPGRLAFAKRAVTPPTHQQARIGEYSAHQSLYNGAEAFHTLLHPS